jgi:hypothetical protein
VYYSLRKTINYETKRFERELYRDYESPIAMSLFIFWNFNTDNKLYAMEETERLKSKFKVRCEERIFR